MNKAQCKLCGQIIVSEKNGVYEFCKCGSIGVSGGHEAILRLGHHNHFVEMSEKDYSQ